jgi:hypothetical protein
MNKLMKKQAVNPQAKSDNFGREQNTQKPK